MKPILFNTEMVQAILQGRKTVTRRIIKGLPQDAKRIGWLTDSGNDESYGVAIFEINDNRKDFKVPCLVGDILYVRETWQKSPTGTYLYKTDNNGNLSNGHVDKWKPSIHMPKGAARIFLRVTDVKVERLHDITLSDVLKEGLEIEKYVTTPLMKKFSNLWDTTVKKELNRYGWDANPYVWVYYFEVISKSEAMKESEEEWNLK